MAEPFCTDAAGQICWLEIPVKDIARAQKFYGDLFGWESSPEPAPGSDSKAGSHFKGMHFFHKGKTLNGAFLILDDDHRVVNHDETRPHALPILPTLNVEDCAETLKKAESLGGKTQWQKTSIGGEMGHYARLIDSEGNMIGVWSQK